jgi:hypothetical protein
MSKPDRLGAVALFAGPQAAAGSAMSRNGTLKSAVAGLAMVLTVAACSTPQASHGAPAATQVAPASAAVTGTPSPAATPAATRTPVPSLAPTSAPIASPSPTSSPTPRPTPDPTELATQFVRWVAAPEGPLRVAWDGRVDQPAFQVTGLLHDAGQDEDSMVSFGSGGDVAAEQVIVAGGVKFRNPDGRWLKSGTSTGSYDFRRLFNGPVLALKFEGVTEISSRPAWLFTIAPRDMDSTALQFIVQGARELKISTTRFEVALDDRGLPVNAQMTAAVSFTTKAGARRQGTAEYTWDFTDVGQPVTVTPPTVYWVIHQSAALGYSMAFPTDKVELQVVKGGVCLMVPCDKETVIGDQVLMFQVYTFFDVPANSTKRIHADVEEMLENAFGAKLKSTASITVAGREGRLFTVVGEKYGSLYAVLILGKREWDVNCVFEPAHEKEARATLMEMLGTFAISE